jgi:hypothetical protein
MHTIILAIINYAIPVSASVEASTPITGRRKLVSVAPSPKETSVPTKQALAPPQESARPYNSQNTCLNKVH